MFHHIQKDTKKEKHKSIKIKDDLIKFENAHDILTTDKRQTLLKQIKVLSAMNTEYFEKYCLKLIYNLINHCQLMPETSNSFYSQPGGILDYALNRTEAAMQLFRQFMICHDEAVLSDIQKLWLYAMFSASILKDIGKLHIDYTVQLFDENYSLIKQWNSLVESLYLKTGSYKFQFEPDYYEKFLLRRRINILLAKILMPFEGFAWISSNQEILAVWLALLSDDFKNAGTLGAILIRADAVAIARYFDEFMSLSIRSSKSGGRIGSFIDNKNKSATLATEASLGLEFIAWLTKSLESGQIMINKPPLFMVPGGLLIHPDIFKLFITTHTQHTNWQAVLHSFLNLNLHQKNNKGEYLTRFEQVNTHQIHEGILIDKYAIVLPQNVKIHNLYTGKKANITAVELIHLAQHNHLFLQKNQNEPTSAPKYLNSLGKWEAKIVEAILKPGIIKSG